MYGIFGILGWTIFPLLLGVLGLTGIALVGLIYENMVKFIDSIENEKIKNAAIVISIYIIGLFVMKIAL